MPDITFLLIPSSKASNQPTKPLLGCSSSFYFCRGVRGTRAVVAAKIFNAVLLSRVIMPLASTKSAFVQILKPEDKLHLKQVKIRGYQLKRGIHKEQNNDGIILYKYKKKGLNSLDIRLLKKWETSRFN